MTDRSNDDADDGKKPYAKPDIRQVSLRPEEAVLGACKVHKVAGPGQKGCDAPSPCSSLTS
jgi:hypothetical protein